MNEVWLSTAYFGPVRYFQEIRQARKVTIEAFESYERQSWRNRCRILTANGALDLSIPIAKGHSPGQPIRDVRIDYRQGWQKLHYRSIESAYRHSPFYEYLLDEFREYWEKPCRFLFDLNLSITEKVIRLIRSETTVALTQRFEQPGFYGPNDFRYSIHPKKEKSTGIAPVPYHQVFIDRFGFVPDLSILDWLFNCFRT